MANIVSQMRAGPEGLTIRMWEVPESFEIVPDEAWTEQQTDPGTAGMLSMLGGTPPLPRAR